MKFISKIQDLMAATATGPLDWSDQRASTLLSSAIAYVVPPWYILHAEVTVEEEVP